MKTLDEAIECVKHLPADWGPVGKIIMYDDGTSTAKPHLVLPASVENLISISREVIENVNAADLAKSVVESFDYALVPIGHPEQQALFNDHLSMYLTGLAYGIRIGIEMEKP